jgi:hypothetical protein
MVTIKDDSVNRHGIVTFIAGLLLKPEALQFIPIPLVLMAGA